MCFIILYRLSRLCWNSKWNSHSFDSAIFSLGGNSMSFLHRGFAFELNILKLKSWNLFSKDFLRIKIKPFEIVYKE